MEDYVKRMIIEHKDLVIKISKLEAFIYSPKAKDINRFDFANMCVQLNGMKLYEKALMARIVNKGIVFEDGDYFVAVDSIHIPNNCDCCGDCKNYDTCNTDIVDCEKHQFGSDYDVDTEHITHSGELEPNTSDNG